MKNDRCMEKSVYLTSIKVNEICECHDSESDLALNMLLPFYIYIILISKTNIYSFCTALSFPSFTRNTTKKSEVVYGEVIDAKSMGCNANKNARFKNNIHDPDNLW